VQVPGFIDAVGEHRFIGEREAVAARVELAPMGESDPQECEEDDA
jgi:hypothetical protein